MPSNRRNSPLRAKILESGQKPGVEESTQKRRHKELLNIVPMSSTSPTSVPDQFQQIRNGLVEAARAVYGEPVA